MKRFMMESESKLKPLAFEPHGEDRLVLASDGTPWAGIPFEVHDQGPFEGRFESAPAKGVRGLIIVADGFRQVALQEGRTQSTKILTSGVMAFAEGGHYRTALRAIGRARVVVFELSPIWHERLLAEGGAESFAQLPPIPPHETARALALSMCAEVESGASTGAMFAESLSVALLAYMLERTPQTAMRVRGALTNGQRRRLARYIDDHLQEDLTLSEIATLIGFRPRHFSTLFRQSFGMPPHRYLIDRRLERGARLLATTSTEVAEVALMVGFSSQSHFATAFRKRYGTTPRQYARSRRLTLAIEALPTHARVKPSEPEG